MGRDRQGLHSSLPGKDWSPPGACVAVDRAKTELALLLYDLCHEGVSERACVGAPLTMMWAGAESTWLTMIARYAREVGGGDAFDAGT
ncbi:hypothetical protein GCM10009793_17500 [Brachybacterium phenoliresistens]